MLKKKSHGKPVHDRIEVTQQEKAQGTHNTVEQTENAIKKRSLMTTASCLLWQPTEVCKQHPTTEGPGMGKQREGMGIVCLSDEHLKATDFSKHQETPAKLHINTEANQ